VNGYTLIYLYSQKRRNEVLRSFLYFGGWIELWLLIHFIAISLVVDKEILTSLFKVIFSVFIFNGVFFLNFIYALINRKKDFFYFILIIISALFAIITIFTDYIICGYVNVYKGFFGIAHERGKFYPFALFALFWFPHFYSIYLVYRKIKKKDFERLKKPFTLVVLLIGLDLLIVTISDFIFTHVLNIDIPRLYGLITVTTLISIFILVIEKKYKFLFISIDDVSYDLFDVHEGILIINNEFKIIKANKKALEIFNLSEEELLKKSVDMLFPECDLKTGICPKDELKLTINENHKYVSIYETGIKFGPMEYGKILFIRDISDRKMLEEEREMLIIDLEKANNELKQLSQMKDDFLSVASHDLRSPFNGILGFSEVLLTDNSLNEEQKYYITLIKESAEIQLQYVNDILDIIKFEKGKISIDVSPADITELIKISVNSLKILADKKKITLNVELFNPGTINIDFNKISQVMNNFISNAIKFTSAGGFVKIRCFKNDNNEIEIHVIDSGIGIPEDKLEDLFVRYGQYKEFGTSGEKGTGLGLSICKNLVEVHGGKIGVTSKINEGSDFFFTLPLHKSV